MSRDFPATLAHLEAALGHRFATPDLLREALTHRSTTSRRDELGYERLEFLGDRVLGLCVAAMLYRHFPTEAEGKLVYFVSIDACRFRRPIVPGDVMHVHVRKDRSRGNVWRFDCRTLVDGRLAAEAKISAMILDN